MELTKRDRARLAAELCGRKLTSRSDNAGIGNSVEIPAWSFPSFNLGEHILCSDFDPVHNGSHMLLVLEGLVKELSKQRRLPVSFRLWGDNVDFVEDGSMKPDLNYIDFGSAVCTTGLEVIGKDEGAAAAERAKKLPKNMCNGPVTVNFKSKVPDSVEDKP